MASFASTFDSRASQHRWINEICHFLEREIRVDIDIPVSIFRVPTTLSAVKPEAYIPRVVGLGPYHHFQSNLYEMQRYKLAAASRLHKEFQSIQIKDLVCKLVESEHKIRASYHKYLDIDAETLIWIMTIDALFLIDLLRNFIIKDDEVSSTTTTIQLLDSTGQKLTIDAVLSDVMMLENQIPMFFLIETLSMLCNLADVSTKFLPSMLIGFCNIVSPLNIKKDYPLSEVGKHAHLLDLLYHLIVPKLKDSYKCINTYGLEGSMNFVEKDDVESVNSGEVFLSLWKLSSKLNFSFFRKISKPINMLISVPWNMASSFLSNKRGISEDDNESLPKNTEVPIIEEIIIPSVSNLCDAGVEFRPTNGDITSIRFNEKGKRFYLPVITLNVNSEVIMRNLVAYETSSRSETLVFTRYTELMNGIIDTVDDMKILREKKIIVNGLKSDAEAVDLFNGMSKAIRLTNVPHIDKAIADVNKYYYGTLSVRLRQHMKKYVYGSWRILTFLAALLLMLLMTLQSFCSVFSCPNLFHTSD